MQSTSIKFEQYTLELLQQNHHEDINFQVKFPDMKSALNGILKDKLLVLPLHRINNSKEVELILQLQHEKVYDNQLNSKSSALKMKNMQRKRSAELNCIIKILLSERNHVQLYYQMEKIFPKLFNYEYVGVLFRDEKHNDLYALRIQDPDSFKVYDDNMIRFPITLGITGKALQKRKIIVTNDMSDQAVAKSSYSTEIDNFLNLQKIRNIMIGPIEDNCGELRGAIQLINKLDNPQISTSDELELRSILPALGEMIKTADETLKIINISAGLRETLQDMTTNIFEKTEAIQQAKSIPMIGSSVRYMSDLLGKLVSSKKEAVFSDSYMTKQVFQGIKERQLKQKTQLSSLKQ
eukprot:403335187